MPGTSSEAQVNRQIPRDYVGTWAIRCESTSDATIRIGTDRVTVENRGNHHVYNGVDFSYTFGEGVRSSGRKSWILVSTVPNGMYAFVLTVPGFGRTGPIIFEKGAEGEGREVRDLSGARFRRCRQ